MNIFGRRKQQTPLAELQLPENRYAAASYEDNGLPGIMIVNGALHEIAGHKELPCRLGIALKYLDQTNPSGLPSKEELPRLDEMTDLINDSLNGPPRMGYLALRMTGGGVREWVSYVTEERVGHGLAGFLQSRFPDYEVTHYVEHDPKWQAFRAMAPRTRR